MTTNKPEVTSIYNAATGESEEVVSLAEYEALQAANAQLHATIRHLCSLYVVYDHYDGKLREELLDKAVIHAISATMEPTR